MGMWDKDREHGARIDSLVGIGEPFLMLDAYLDGEVATRLGPAKRARIVLARIKGGRPGTVLTGSTLAQAITSKIADAEDEDFPVVAQLLKVPTEYENDALVVQLVGPWDGPVPEVPERP